MASPFKIPKKKQSGGSDPAPMHMQSPLSRLQSSNPGIKSGYTAQSSRDRADRMHAGNTLGSSTNTQRPPCKPSFNNVVKSPLGLNRRASTANQREAGGLSSQEQRAESSSSCFSNGWRPKRASDRLLPPDLTTERESPPQKKKSGESSGSSPSERRISVESLDSLADLRDAKHAGSFSSPEKWDASEGKSDRGTSLQTSKRQQSSSSSGSDRTSEDDFASLSRIRNLPSADKSLPNNSRRPSASWSARTPSQSSRTTQLASGRNLRDDPREKERQRWREFREKRTPYRSAVLQLRLKNPKPTPMEPIVLSSEEEEEGEDDGDGGKPQSSGRVEEPEQTQGQDTLSSRGESEAYKSPLPPPSFLQLEFTSLHVGLTHANANGKITINDIGITIPLKGAEEGEVTVVASQVQGYGVWDGGLAQGGTLLNGCKGPAPSLLFLWVTDAQANLLQMELTAIQASTTSSGPLCCFLLLVLKEQLPELQAALLASILDMEEYKKGYASHSGPASPLDWTDGLLLLHSCPPPLDQRLLQLLGCSTGKSSQVRSNQRSRTSGPNAPGLQHLSTRLIQYPASPCKGRITVTKEDLACLDDGEFLNDVIIDFYLKYVLLEGVGGLVAERSHIFSSFFYKQLSRRRAAGENDAPSIADRHMRHQRVKTWTRHVDIFTKDFLFVPVNQEAHWFLVVVCFPGLEKVQQEKFQSSSGGSEHAAGKPSAGLRLQQPPCLQRSCHRDTVLKRPCILVMDSLKLSYHDNVCRLLRDYLQVEWEVRRGTPRLFTPDSMRSSNCRVPQQDNSSDCGLYLLQYAESFLQNPVVHFDLPVHLENWFPRQRVRRKREEIRSLIMRMHQSQVDRK